MWRRDDARAVEARARGLDHRGRAAHVDVAGGDVGHELEQVLRREQLGGLAVVADDVVELDPAPAGQLVELVAQDHVLGPQGAVDDGDVPRLRPACPPAAPGSA